VVVGVGVVVTNEQQSERTHPPTAQMTPAFCASFTHGLGGHKYDAQVGLGVVTGGGVVVMGTQQYFTVHFPLPQWLPRQKKADGFALLKESPAGQLKVAHVGGGGVVVGTSVVVTFTGVVVGALVATGRTVLQGGGGAPVFVPPA
jgi:hypothetical protein